MTGAASSTSATSWLARGDEVEVDAVVAVNDHPDDPPLAGRGHGEVLEVEAGLRDDGSDEVGDPLAGRGGHADLLASAVVGGARTSAAGAEPNRI